MRTDFHKGWRQALFFLLAVAVLAGAAPEAGATILANLSLEQVVGLSDMVATGVIASKDVRWDDEGRKINTYYEFVVHTPVKGPVHAGDALTLRFIGGQVDGFASVAAGVPSFTAGDEVLLFLNDKEDGTFGTIGWELTRYSLTTDPGTGIVTASRNGISAGVRIHGSLDGTPLPDSVPLEEFLSAIEDIMASQDKRSTRGEVAP